VNENARNCYRKTCNTDLQESKPQERKGGTTGYRCEGRKKVDEPRGDIGAVR
jgi:hypothetical protein